MNLKTVTDLREKTMMMLKQAQKAVEPMYILHHSKPQAVLLGIDAYSKLRDLAEDAIDMQSAKEYEKENKSGVPWLSHDKLIKELA